MSQGALYVVVQGGSGWQLTRGGTTPLVEFPTERQALRAAVALCEDEGLPRFVIRRASGAEEEVDPLLLSGETFAA
jgi:hypothetical protein